MPAAVISSCRSHTDDQAVVCCPAMKGSRSPHPLLISPWHSLCLWAGIRGQPMPTPSAIRRAQLSSAIALALVASVIAVPAAAQGQHRARLSRDLADRLANRVEAPAEIIVAGSD